MIFYATLIDKRAHSLINKRCTLNFPGDGLDVSFYLVIHLSSKTYSDYDVCDACGGLPCDVVAPPPSIPVDASSFQPVLAFPSRLPCLASASQ